jgi:hypothetical protein
MEGLAKRNVSLRLVTIGHRLDQNPGQTSTPVHTQAHHSPYPGVYETASTPIANTASVERFNRTVHYGWLAQCLFGSIGEVQEYAARWPWAGSHPNSG